MSSQKMNIGNYLLRRLKDIGVDIVFGVPGDYNLVQYPSASVFLSSKLDFDFFLVAIS